MCYNIIITIKELTMKTITLIIDKTSAIGFTDKISAMQKAKSIGGKNNFSYNPIEKSWNIKYDEDQKYSSEMLVYLFNKGWKKVN
jgi:hypothetical protein